MDLERCEGEWWNFHLWGNLPLTWRTLPVGYHKNPSSLRLLHTTPANTEQHRQLTGYSLKRSKTWQTPIQDVHLQKQALTNNSNRSNTLIRQNSLNVSVVVCWCVYELAFSLLEGEVYPFSFLLKIFSPIFSSWALYAYPSLCIKTKCILGFKRKCKHCSSFKSKHCSVCLSIQTSLTEPFWGRTISLSTQWQTGGLLRNFF